MLRLAKHIPRAFPGRSFTALAIETSHDDTAVAVLRRHHGGLSILLDERVSSDNRAYLGVNPTVAVEGHNAWTARLVLRARETMRDKVPDVICVTRGPGSMANLSVGLNTAKGLSVAWGVPLVGVHHMQAHALTPRLVSALEGGEGPEFPFLTLLVSGGHTQLVLSEGLTVHRVLATTADVAVGNLLDQTARVILPPELLRESKDVMYARELEAYAFPQGRGYEFFHPAANRAAEEEELDTGWAWRLNLPLAGTRKLAYSFSGIHSRVHAIAAENARMSPDERRDLARHTMRAAFQHIVGRLVLALQDSPALAPLVPRLTTLVVAGGVASNKFLMHVLRSTLAVRGFGHLSVVSPPQGLCTDNAAMIAWAGMEMYDAGWRSDLSIVPIARWPMDPSSNGGITGASGWFKDTSPQS